MDKISYTNLAIALMFAISACSGNRQETQPLVQREAIPVEVMPLAMQDTAQVIMASGTFTTEEETVLSFKNGGIMQQLHVKEGDAFRKGQLLATLDPTEINTAVRQSQLVLEKAERDYSRARQLYRDSVATLEQMQNAKTAFEVAQQDADRASYNLGHNAMRAPFDGYVLQRPVNVGQVVGPGMPVLVVSGTGRSGWLLRVGVGDRQWAAIRVGDAAQITSGTVADISIPAVVHRKSEGLDPQSGTFSVYLKLQGNELPDLALGMFGQATITLSDKLDAWLIPYDALLDGDAGKGYVFVTNDGHTARRVEVQLGDIQKDHVVVTGGLEHARDLIVSGSPYLRDGAEIMIK